MTARGPWLQTAVLAAQVGADAEGRMAATGIVDGIELEAGATVRLQLVLVLVRGDWAGPIPLRVVALDPTGAAIARLDAEADPPAVASAQARVVVPIELSAGQPGVFWLEVQLGETTATRVPLRIDWRTTT